MTCPAVGWWHNPPPVQGLGHKSSAVRCLSPSSKRKKEKHKRRSLLLSSVKGKETSISICLRLFWRVDLSTEECPATGLLGWLRGCREPAPSEAVPLVWFGNCSVGGLKPSSQQAHHNSFLSLSLAR